MMQFMSDVCRIPPFELRRVIADILVKHEIRPTDAHAQAEIWVEADLRGQPSHGVQRLFTMLGRIRQGRVKTDSAPTFTWLKPAVLSVDGDDGLGAPTALGVVDALPKAARSQGVSVGVVRRAHHLGMLSPYVERMASEGFVGLALCTSEALVHPWGGFEPLVGTNPLAIALPVEGQSPISVDMSTGATSRGRILHHALVDQPLEPGWAVDAHGVPTTDPQAAIDGAISPFGGPKGYALGLAIEVLVASLTGTALGTAVTGTLDETEPVTKGDVFLCIDLGVNRVPHMAEHLNEYLAALRSSSPVPGGAGVLVPGDRARTVRLRNETLGVPVDAGLWLKIQTIHEAEKDEG